MKSISFLFIFFLTIHSHCGPFKITNRSGDAIALLAMDYLENEVNKNLPDANHSEYLKGVANSFVIAGHGIGTDYASNISVFELAYSIGFGVDPGNRYTLNDIVRTDFDATKIRGFGLQTAFLFGIHLGATGLHNTNLYFHYMSAGTPEIDNLEGKIHSFGFHIQHALLRKINTEIKSLSFGGVFFTTGFEYSSTNFTFTKDLEEQASDPSNTTTASFSGNAIIGANIKTYSIPFELSTNTTIFYIFTPYLGIGADLNFGEAISIAEISGDVAVSGAGSGSGTANLDIGEKESPSQFTFRSFAGLQLNLAFLKLYAGLQKSFTENTWAVSTGARIAW